MTEPTHEEQVAALRTAILALEMTACIFPDGIVAGKLPALRAVLVRLEADGQRRPIDKGHLRKLGRRDGIRHAISWLHARAKTMNDPHAKAILNVAASDLGVESRPLPAPPSDTPPSQLSLAVIEVMAQAIDPGAWRPDPYSSDGGNHRRFLARQKASAAYRAIGYE